MIATLGGCLARVARRVSQATLALCLAGGSTLALADDSRGTMLSLGDSVVFGYITQDGPAYVNADNFISYPEIVGNALRLDTANPSCPGETTAGFLSLTGADNGCRPFRSRFPLHESYSSTQLDYALAYLGANKRKTRLVTLSLGANDGFLLIAACNNNYADRDDLQPGGVRGWRHVVIRVDHAIRIRVFPVERPHIDDVRLQRAWGAAVPRTPSRRRGARARTATSATATRRATSGGSVHRGRRCPRLRK